jgi:hypothetical protein
VAVVGGLVGLVAVWWAIKATISMAKRVMALAFVLGLTAVLLAGSATAFLATHR